MLHVHMALISGHTQAPNLMSSAAFDFIFPLWNWKNRSVQPGDDLSLGIKNATISLLLCLGPLGLLRREHTDSPAALRDTCT